ncbi:MAG: ABC transporter permease subunit [Lachnospiraceae bacterium]|nr:ABC transporter permease subunit [Lachnospiraceae bacterium]MDD7025987.1 ABC transporter permease subunit [Lachnospiraceae bacterium]MDY5699675.1 ABC transporter permease subunit [Lachnospiraceae bacterium]
MRKKEKNKDIRLWAVLVWLIVWQLVSMALNSDILLVSPLKVVIRLLELTGEISFWKSIVYSLLRIGGGFLTALLAGSLWAALSARFLLVRQLLAPVVLITKTIPVASFIILALVWFSSRNLAVLISFLMVFPVIYTNVLNGIIQTDRELLEMAEVFSVAAGRRIRYIYLPQVMPYLRAGCSVALGLCWKSGIAAEVIGMPKGSIGERLQQAKVYLDTADLFAWTLVIVVVSLLFEWLFLWLLDRSTRAVERM